MFSFGYNEAMHARALYAREQERLAMARQSSKKPKTEAAQATESIATNSQTSTSKAASSSSEETPQKKAKASGASAKSSSSTSAKTAKSSGKSSPKPAAKKTSSSKAAPKKAAAKAQEKPSADAALTAVADAEAASTAAQEKAKPAQKPQAKGAKATTGSKTKAKAKKPAAKATGATTPAKAKASNGTDEAKKTAVAAAADSPAATTTAAAATDDAGKNAKPAPKATNVAAKKAHDASKSEAATSPAAAAAKQPEETVAPDSLTEAAANDSTSAVAPETATDTAEAPETAATSTAAPMPTVPAATAPEGAPNNLRTMPPIAYGQVKPLQKKRSRKGAIAAIVVIAAVVIAAVVAAPKIIESMRPDQMLPSTAGPVTTLTTKRVSEDLENADIPLPDLSAYSYILTDDLIGPRFSLPDIEDMVQTVSGSNPVYSQKITTKATYNNKGIRIIVPISMVYTYNESGQTWVHDEPVLGTPETTPLSAASYEAVLADIDLIIRDYDDADYKALFRTAEVTSHTSNLTKDGGTIAVGLYAQTESHTASSTATVELTWDNAKGWVAAITEVSTPERAERNLKEEILAKEEEEKAKKEEEEYANEERPQYYIECSSNDVVEFNGKMTKAGNGYLLTLNDPLRLTLDGKLCYVYTVQLNFGEYEEYSAWKPEDIDPAALVGSNQGFAGTLSLTSAGNQAVKDAAAKDRDHASEKGAPLVAMQVIEV